MKPADALKHTIAMLAAGIVASGLILAASLLSPAAEPALQAQTSEPETASLNVESIAGRWEFIDDGPSAALEFTEYGSWNSSDGCTGFGSTWHPKGNAIVLRPNHAPWGRSCGERVLPQVTTIEGILAADGTLQLRGAGGFSSDLRRVADSRSTLTGGDWATPNTRLPVATPDPTGPSLRFSPDGTWTGSDGCNRFWGTWSWDLIEGEEPLGGSHEHEDFGAILHFGEETQSTEIDCSSKREPTLTFTGDYEFYVYLNEFSMKKRSDPQSPWYSFTKFPAWPLESLPKPRPA